tara:strand:- start:734 stop:1183 length:450 start_codon:yes stop_codon:yes gene_type:complete
MKSFQHFLLERNFKSNAYSKQLLLQPNKPFRYISLTTKERHQYPKNFPFVYNLEPHGKYMWLYDTRFDKSIEDFWNIPGTHPILGVQTFNRPLYINYGSEYGGWKKVLHQHYKRTGKELSKVIVRDYYDSIVTVSKGKVYEIVDLSEFL